ncbi:GNAT family N-acetyltransferase [Methylorubrum zatmanii]|uniref:GNAT family N-acetyltransferase n=1 Tax=Methylorubrum zatmanii TaxID=29429 RepID=A0ABW1WZ57_9HYPH|nr:GNAT family N-acetyltransferase [Methylorubrum zatmanii]MBD8905195.1 GNAT family N-acetyltransferase [Methylorubrum zatmanii]
MTTNTVSIRRARVADAAGLSAVFDAAWREAYQGVIPGVALERFLVRRGPATWRAMIGSGRGLAVVAFDEQVAGYATYGRTRDRALATDGEIDELYIAPEFQGLGLGSRLFRAVRNDLIDRGLTRIGVWALADNTRACAFYERLGGVTGPISVERLSGICLPKVAYLFF